MTSLRLTWKLTNKRNALGIAYTVHNSGASAVYILDQLLVLVPAGLAIEPDAVIALQQVAGGPVSLIRGYIPAQADVRVRILPGARKLAPNESLTGHAQVKLPLAAWHPRDGTSAITGKPTAAVLRLGYVAGDTPLREQTLADGTIVHVPAAAQMQHQQFVEASPLALP